MSRDGYRGVSLPGELYEKLEVYARAHYKSVAAVVKDAVNAVLEPPAPPVRPSPLPSRPAPSPEPDEEPAVASSVPITPPAATPPTAAPVPGPEPARAERAARPRAGPDRGRPSHSTAPPPMNPELDRAVKGEAPRLEVDVEVLADQIRKDKRRGLETGAREALLARETARSGADAKPAAPRPAAPPAAADEAPLFSTFTCQACGQTLPTAIYDAHKKTCSPKEVQATLPSESSAGPAASAPPAYPVPNLDRLGRFVLDTAGAGTIPELLAIARRGLDEQHIPADRQPADDVLAAWLKDLAKKNATARRVTGRPSA